MKIYELSLYSDKHGNALREYDLPDNIVQIWEDAKDKGDVWLNNLFIYKYLKANKTKLLVMELTCEERKKERIDVEYTTALNSWCVSQKFKNFIKQEDIPLDFFKATAKGEEGRYLTMREGLSIIYDEEIDQVNSKWSNYGDWLAINWKVFRSDIIEYYGYEMFTNSTHTWIYITDKLKKKFEEQGFKFSYREIPVTQIPLNREKLEKELIEIRQKIKASREDWRYERRQAVDDYLVEVLQEEWWKEEEIERLRESWLIGGY